MDGLTVDLRPAVAADVRSLYATWRLAFGEVPWQVPLYEQDAGRLRRTFVAVVDGAVQASVYYLVRPIRTVGGAVDQVGCVANVATHPATRGRGLVRRLLALAVADMEQRELAWSLLFTGTPGVYEGSGWRGFTCDIAAGELAPGTAATSRHTVGEVSLDEWRPLARLHAEFNRRRALTTVRTEDDWLVRVPVWYADSEVLTSWTGTEYDGYLVLRWNSDSVEVQEAGVTSAAAADALFAEVRRRAGLRRVSSCILRVPADPLLHRATDGLLRSPEIVTDATGMIRELGSTAVRAAIQRDPGAIHWPADYF